MGRTGSPRKASPAARTLSSRIATPSSLSFAPSPLSRPSVTSVSPLASTSASPAGTTASSPMGQKRPIDQVAEPVAAATPKSLKPNKRHKKKQAKRDAIAAKLGEEPELEEGEVVEGDFSDLFMFDTTPAAVSKENAYTKEEEALGSPSRQKEGKDGATDFTLVDDETKREGGDKSLDEEDLMKVFAKEVAMSDDEEDDSSEEEDNTGPGINIEAMMLYDDEEGLQEAIQGKIVDDSSAPVAGRYYKEADLTKSCVLCGESGHTSRDCTHSQCFICGQIDVEHEARNCPVTLVCSACGSRGHFARDCDVTSSHGRYGGHQRCSICQSNNHNPTNCSTLWRIYDTSGPKPQKRKIVCACANCGSTKDHFIDDCLLPRGHPMKYADASAFNRDALGSSAASLPAYSAGGPTSSSASRRRNGGGSTGRGSTSRRDDYDDQADDDWFASRARTAAGNGGPRSGSSTPRGGGSRGFGSASVGGGGGRGKGSTRGSGTHIHFGGFSDSSRDRFQSNSGGGGSASSSRSYRDSDRSDSGRGGYDSPRERDSWKKSNSGSEDRGGGRSYAGSRKPPSLLDRVGGGGSSSGKGGGGGSSRRPKYSGGYV